MKILIQSWQNDLATYEGDWSAQGFWALAVHRFGDWRYSLTFTPARKVASLLYRFSFKLVQLIAGIELPCEAKVGQGCRIDHFGGIIVSGYAEIGDGCILRQGVTLGLRHVDHPTAPRLGQRVDVGAGAKILGPLTIGDGAVIGANAVVLSDIPAGAVAVGIPARVIRK